LTDFVVLSFRTCSFSGELRTKIKLAQSTDAYSISAY
jgi:hypothetical protein